MPPTGKSLEARLGHTFASPALLREALTHSSKTRMATDDNRRLEFLGDRVLGLVVAELISEQRRDAPVGELAARFNAAVSGSACAEVAAGLELGSALRLGKAEQLSGGRSKEAILGGAMEAVIGAVYLDGGFETAKRVVRGLWEPRLAHPGTEHRNPKSTLQEWAQARGLEPPFYRVVRTTGPAHKPSFEIEAVLQSGERSVAKAGTKQRAELIAAKELLDQLG